MTRVDRPALKCDRVSCGIVTEDLREMGGYQRIQLDHMSGRDSWDLCPKCYGDFKEFIQNRGDDADNN